MPTLHEETRIQRFRRYLSSRAWIEPAIFMATFFVIVWVVAPHLKNKGIVQATLALIAMPLASMAFHGDHPKDLGFRFDNFKTSARGLLRLTLGLTFLTVLIGLTFGWRLNFDEKFFERILLYLPWALGQQFVLLGFVYRRLRQFFFAPLAIPIATALFGLTHFPNPLLVIGTAFAALFWIRNFERTPNLFVVALSQSWLAALVITQVPKSIHLGMVVGPRLWP